MPQSAVVFEFSKSTRRKNATPHSILEAPARVDLEALGLTLEEGSSEYREPEVRKGEGSLRAARLRVQTASRPRAAARGREWPANLLGAVWVKAYGSPADVTA